MELKTQININATPKMVWEKLTNFTDYSWNPFIKSIAGNIKKGNFINVELGGMKFKPEVLQFETNKEFRWKGKLFVKGLFDGEHYFILEEQADGSTVFIQGEIFSGILIPLLKKKLKGETKDYFVAMNDALKLLAEQVS